MNLVSCKFTLTPVEAVKKIALLSAAGIRLPQNLQDFDKVHCNYSFVATPLTGSTNPQAIIDILDHVKPETFKIDAINLQQIQEYIDVLHDLLRLAEKMRTMARFVPTELPEPEPVVKKSWWKRLWS